MDLILDVVVVVISVEVIVVIAYIATYRCMIKIIWICVSVGTVESIGIVIVVIDSTATFLVDPKSTLELIVVVLLVNVSSQPYHCTRTVQWI